MLTTIIGFITSVIFLYCFYIIYRMKKKAYETKMRLEEFAKELEKKKKLLDTPEKRRYNKRRETIVNRMVGLKLVYNEETDEWEKLKELEE